jgi:hypothetical protein
MSVPSCRFCPVGRRLRHAISLERRKEGYSIAAEASRRLTRSGFGRRLRQGTLSTMALADIRLQGFVVLDGGLATELERRGADLSDPLWSAKQLLEGPEADSPRFTRPIMPRAPTSRFRRATRPASRLHRPRGDIRGGAAPHRAERRAGPRGAGAFLECRGPLRAAGPAPGRWLGRPVGGGAGRRIGVPRELRGLPAGAGGLSWAAARGADRRGA